MAAFLGGRIGFLDIAATVERTLERLAPVRLGGIADVWAQDRAARLCAQGLINTLS